jgi:hypothetical protein
VAVAGHRQSADAVSPGNERHRRTTSRSDGDAITVVPAVDGLYAERRHGAHGHPTAGRWVTIVPVDYGNSTASNS